MSTKSRLLSLLGATIVFTVVACADSATAPQPRGARAPRDTMPVQGDTTECRSGFIIVNGRVVCNPDM